MAPTGNRKYTYTYTGYIFFVPVQKSYKITAMSKRVDLFFCAHPVDMEAVNTLPPIVYLDIHHSVFISIFKVISQ